MLKLDFKINKVYLYAKTIKQAKLLGRAGELLEKRLWNKSETAYSLVSGVCYDRVASRIALSNLTVKSFSKNLIQNIESAEEILTQELESEEFLSVIRETEEYKNIIAKKWTENQEQALKILTDITGLEMPNKAIPVYLVHPKLHDGRYWHEDEKDIISWGHSEDWENYSIVYLCHELMHFLFKDRKEDKKLLHALIELSCDNELRIRLNKRGEYFREGNFGIGHKNLRELEETLLPQWQQYLQGKENVGSILQLAQELEGNSLK